MSPRRTNPDLDRELAHLPPAQWWGEWMRRIEAVLFASASPVQREGLVLVVGREASLDLLIEDLRADLVERPYEVAAVGAGWALKTRPVYAPAIRAASDLLDRGPRLNERDAALLAAIAHHQPITRAGLAAIFGREFSRETIDRLRAGG